MCQFFKKICATKGEDFAVERAYITKLVSKLNETNDEKRLDRNWTSHKYG